MKGRKTSFSFRGIPILVLVLTGYGILFLVNVSKAVSALQKSGMVLLKLLPIFAAVILLISVINYFLHAEKIVKYLGAESGLKGWLLALFAGVISHGPMYAWYPMLEDLRSHGGRDGLIAVFFYARCIKVPLLPMMIDYFGVLFTLVLSCYILIGALLQGWMLEWLEKW